MDTQNTGQLTIEDRWATADYALPSENQHKEAQDSAFENYEFPEGMYQWAITDISQRFENSYAKDPEKSDRRAITFTCVSQNGKQEGPHIGHSRQGWYNVSSHPTSALYPIFKAVAGGYLDPNINPKLTDLRDGQFTAVLVRKPSKQDPSKIVENFEAIFPAQERLPVVPF